VRKRKNVFVFERKRDRKLRERNRDGRERATIIQNGITVEKMQRSR